MALRSTHSRPDVPQGSRYQKPHYNSPLVVLVVSLFVLFNVVSAEEDTDVRYEVFAIRYAEIPAFPVAELVAGADPSRKLDIHMMVWLLRGSDGRNILVDSGFYRKTLFSEWKIRNFVSPAEAISRIGLKPDEITDIIITHMHWDHVGGVELFPKARVWIQKEEFHFYAGEAWHSSTAHDGIEPEDVLTLVKMNTEGRVKFVNGDAQEIISGITCYIGGRHTYASQYVSVNTRAGTIVIASDNLYLYENLERHAPIAQTLDADSNLEAQDRMKRIASRPELIIPGHDPAVFSKFREGINGVARIE